MVNRIAPPCFHYRLNKFLPLEIPKIIYITIVLPHLNYGIILWYSAPSYIIQKLFVSQKKCIRAICGLEYNQTTQPHFKNLNLLKLSEIYKRNLLLHFHDTIFEDMNPNLQNIIKSHSDFHSYNTRIKSNIVLPQVNRTKTRFNFYCRGIDEWNLLPQEIRNIVSKYSFARKLFSYFVSKY